MYYPFNPVRRTSQMLPLIVIASILCLTGLIWVISPTLSLPLASKTPSLSQIPLYFEANNGQTSDVVRYLARGEGYQVFMTPDTVAFRLLTTTGSYNAHLTFEGANPLPTMTGEQPQVGVSSYMTGAESDWVTGVSHYGAVRYNALYNGIDALFYGNARQLQYDFLIAPQADPSLIRLNVAPAEALTLTETGDLHLRLGDQTLVMHAPYSYQQINGVIQEVKSAFLIEDGTIGFTLGAYDPAYELVIDPVVSYSSFFGGSGSESIADIAVDGYGNFYITGMTESTQVTFPEVVGPDLTIGSPTFADAYVAKFANNGTTLLYAGYIGGEGHDEATDIAVDASGNVYIIGSTRSHHSTFPKLVGPDLTYNGSANEDGGDAFVAKVNSDGTGLVYAGYIGSNSNDYGYGIAVDAAGSAYVTGYTQAHPVTLVEMPLTVGPSLTRGGEDDVFVGKISPNGANFAYLGLVGGSQNDDATTIVVGSDGGAYVTGRTVSTDFPVTAGMSNEQGDFDAFVFKVKPDGTALDFSGHIGGTGYESGTSLVLDTAGNIYIGGGTDSTTASFPAVNSSNFGTVGGVQDLFLTKLVPNGTATLYRARVSGSGGDGVHDLALDSANRLYFVGQTNSTEATFPETGDLDLTQNGGYDGILGRLSANGTVIDFLGFVGGGNFDAVDGVAVDTAGNIYIVGGTYSSGFPVVAAFDSSYNGSGDGFFAKYGNATLYYPEMLLNPSFEIAGTTPKKAAHWTITNPTSADRRLCSTPEKPIVVPDGQCLFQFSANAAPSVGRTLKQTVNVPPFDATGKRLVFSMHVDANKLKTGMKVILTVTYTDGTTARVNLPIEQGTYTRKFGGELALTKPIKKVVVNINAAKITGRLRIDNLSLVVADMPTALPFPEANVTTRDGVTLDLPAAPDGFRN